MAKRLKPLPGLLARRLGSSGRGTLWWQYFTSSGLRLVYTVIPLALFAHVNKLQPDQRDFWWTFWVGQASFRLTGPYNPELVLTSTFQFDEGENSLAVPCISTKHRWEGDVQVVFCTSPTKSAQPSKLSKKALCARRTCGGKQIYLSGPVQWRWWKRGQPWQKQGEKFKSKMDRVSLHTFIILNFILHNLY